jgi:hypothetical protein
MKAVLKFGLLLLLTTSSAWGDSPLTSTPFHEAYADLEAVRRAAETGTLDEGTARYLLDENNSLDERLAVCNALGWKFSGQNNGAKFLQRLGLTDDTWFMPVSWRELPADRLIILAYLNSLDDYFDVKAELEQARVALNKDPENAAILVITALIEGQVVMDNPKNWHLVWNSAIGPLESEGPDKLRPEARKIIEDYLRLYK